MSIIPKDLYHGKLESFCLNRKAYKCTYSTDHQKNSCTQKEVWDCSAVGKEDKGYQDPYLLAEGSEAKE